MEFLSAISKDDNFPPFLEVTLSNQLTGLIKPLCNHIVSVIIEKYQILLPIDFYRDEIYSILTMIINIPYLVEFNSSFSDYFYGLKRTSKFTSNLLLLVAPDYLFAKFYHLIPLKIQEIIEYSCRILNFMYSIAFVFGKTRYTSLIHQILDVEMHRLSPSDLSKTPKNNLLKVIIPFTLFAVRFIEFYQTSDFTRPKITIPPVPLLIQTRRYKGCGVCGKDYENATCIPSGVVCCYRCIYEFVLENKRCPITGIKTSIQDLRKVFLNVF